jgi:carbon-monoxide dehydrogenase medium subunit
MYAFDYARPTSLDEAKTALSGDAKLLAGGQTLLPTLKLRLAQHEKIVDLGAIADLKGIKKDGDTLVIGAMTTHAAVAESADVRAAIPGLADVAEGIGDPAVRHRGTIGGSLANNDPAADYPAAVLALGATIHTTKRTISADDFFDGMFGTVLEDDEIITAIAIPVAESFKYAKFPNPASRYALVGAAVAKTAGGVRVAISGAGQDGVFRWSDAEAALSGNFSGAAIDGLSVDPSGLMSDIHADSDYRAHLVKIMTKRAVG